MNSFKRIFNSNKILVFLILGGLCLSGYSTYNSIYPRPWVTKFKDDKNLEVIEDKKFANEVVPLDGKRYIRCDFTNVSLKWNGIKPFSITYSNFYGGSRFTSENDVINGVVVTLKSIGWLKDDIPVLIGPKSEPLDPHSIFKK